MIGATMPASEGESKRVSLKEQNRLLLQRFEEQPEFQEILAHLKVIYRVLAFHEHPLTMSEQPKEQINDEGDHAYDMHLEVSSLGPGMEGLLKYIQIELDKHVDEWADIVEHFYDDFKFQRVRKAKQKELDALRSHVRTMANKAREQELIDKRNQRQLEKMNAKSKVPDTSVKRVKTRSPPPTKTKIEKQVIVDKDKLT